MLLGNGFLLNKLPLSQVGGQTSNNVMIFRLGDGSFSNKASIPNGYGGKSAILPYVAGNISSYVEIYVSNQCYGAMGINAEANADTTVFFANADGELIVGGFGSSSVNINASGNVIAGLFGFGTSNISIYASSNAMFADGYASAQLDVITTGQGQLTAIAIMSGTSVDNTGELTPAQIWAYDNRTLTSIDVDVSGLTKEEHDKLMKLITKSEFIALKDV